MPRDPAPFLLGAAVAAFYGPLAPELVRDWSSGGDFSHGFFVPIVSAVLLFARRHELRAAEVRPFRPGALLLGFGVCQLLVGAAASETWLQRSSIVPFLLGWVLLVWGPGRFRICLFPVLFLLFMIPPPSLYWSSAAFRLQLLASRVAEGFLRTAGIDVERAGNVLDLPGCVLEIDRACSGLRSVVTLLAISALLAEGTLVAGGPRRGVSRGLLFLAALPVAVAANALRVSLTAWLVVEVGRGAANGWPHRLAGIAMFAVAVGLLWVTRGGLGWIERLKSVSSQPS